MISVDVARMAYPIPKRYREWVRHPLRPRRRVEALCGVRLQIAAGEHVALLGPNGAGKTTLLKLMSGLLYPTEGRVEIDGIDPARDGVAIRRKVGLVINEDRSFYWRLTGYENLEFFGMLDNLTGAALRERATSLLALVGLAEAAHRPVADYSSGMRQRLAIARGLLADPVVLLLDEPTRSLDPMGADQIRRLITDRINVDRRRTLVLATNRIDDVTGLCDRLVVIHHGRLASSVDRVQGCSAELITEAYRRAVGGEARAS